MRFSKEKKKEEKEKFVSGEMKCGEMSENASLFAILSLS